MEKSQEELDAQKMMGMQPALEKRRIERCGGDYWYKNMIGEIISVHHYGSFGVWDEQGRWYSCYDLSVRL